MLSKFLRRPETIELICPVQFAKMFTTSGVKINKKEMKQAEEIDIEEMELEPNLGEDIDLSDKKKFHSIITETNEWVPLPDLIEISEPYPGEPKIMRKRKGPAVLRYHKGNKENRYEEWMLKELMLYTPYRETDLDDYENNTAEMYRKKESWIKSVKSKVMEHLESVEEARYMMEQSTKEIDMTDIGIQLDAAHEQDQADCQLEGVAEHPDYLHLDTDGIEINAKMTAQTGIFKKILVPSIPALREETRQVSEESYQYSCKVC